MKSISFMAEKAGAAPGDGAAIGREVDHLFRRRAGQMVSTLTRIFGFEHIDLAEDVVQDALVQALRLWPYSGVPDNPTAWLIQVAKNKAFDALRRRGIWRGKAEELRRALEGAGENTERDEHAFAGEVRDDQLHMIFTCCHPALSRDAQVSLTLKIIGGFSVAELCRAFFVQPATMAQRLLRAKQRLRQDGARLELPGAAELPARLDAVLEVVYLMFNEGHSPLEGEAPVRTDLCHEAIRLAELLCGHPSTGRPKTRALAALLLFQGSRLATRTDPAGELLLLADQDRLLWDRRMIGHGLERLRQAGQGDELTEYHLQAEIAACHALAPDPGQTDWRRVLDCYDSLLRLNPSPIVALNRAVALERVAGPQPAFDALVELDRHRELRSYYPAFAVRAEFLTQLGRIREARECYDRVLELTSSPPVRRLCARRRTALVGGDADV